MSNLMKGKKYGLSLPKSSLEEPAKPNPMANSAMVTKSNVFGDDDSDSGGSGGDDWVKQSLKAKTAKSSGLKKQTKILMAKALEEDPTVYQYDEVYDKIEENKVQKETAKKEVDRKPKYIKQLLKTALVRNKEHERRVERQVQKERELEGEEFKDKESFVTSAFRKKMEEMAKEEEEERRQDAVESALDVRKQGDMSGFYRHIYRQTMGEEKGQGEEKVKEEPVEVKEEPVESDDEKKEKELSVKKINNKKREYRKRDDDEDKEEDKEESSSGESESDKEDVVKKTDESKEKGEEDKKKRLELIEQKEKRERRKRRIEHDESSSESEDEDADKSKSKVAKNDATLVDEQGEVLTVEEEEEKPKIDIWKKRTVGEVFEAAVERFWMRKAERDSRQS